MQRIIPTLITASALLLVGAGCGRDGSSQVTDVMADGQSAVTLNGDPVAAPAKIEVPMLSEQEAASFEAAAVSADSGQTKIDADIFNTVGYQTFYELGSYGPDYVFSHVELGKIGDTNYLRGYFGLPEPKDGLVYEGWLTAKGSDKRISVGSPTFNAVTKRWDLRYSSTTDLVNFDTFVLMSKDASGKTARVLEGFGGEER